MKTNLFRTFFIVLFLAVMPAAFAGSPFPAKEKSGDGVVRILAIGNSFSEDAVEQYLYELAEAAGVKVIIGNIYYPGCSLERHANNVRNDVAEYRYRKIVGGKTEQCDSATIKYALADESWDYVSVQQASHFSGMPETYEPYLRELVDYVRQGVRKDTKLMFHFTWAYSKDSTHDGFKNYGNDQMKMYCSIVDAVKKADDEIGFDIIIPCGTAIQNGRTSSLGDTFNRDGYHLQLTYGRYTAACTWLEAVLGKDAVGNAYAPEGVTPLQKRIAQESAHEAVLHPFTVTEIKY